MTFTLRDLYNFLLEYYGNNKKFPKLDEISEKFKIKRHKVIELLRMLEDKKLINRSGSNYFFPKKDEKIKLNKMDSIKIVALKSFIFLVGIMATYMSFYYTKLWFLNMTSVFKSVIMSFVVVGFNVIAFEAVILFYRNKQKIVTIIFVFLGIIILLFNMISTIAGQLSLEMNKERQQQVSSVEIDNNIILYKEYEKQIEDIKIDIDSKRKERNKLLEFVNNTEFNKEYKDLNFRIYLKNQDIERLKKELSDVQFKKQSLLIGKLQINVQKKMTFYEWLEKIFKTNRNIFQFVLQIFPAIFLDIISPLSFGIIIFYKKL